MSRGIAAAKARPSPVAADERAPGARREGRLIAACGQLDAKSMDRSAEVWPAVERMAVAASSRAVDLLVLPEVVYPSYWLESRERYRRGDIERSEAVMGRLSALAARHGLWVVAGFVEEEGDRLFNSAAVFDRGGRRAGTTRKQFLWDCDGLWFAAGRESRVFATEFGRVGVLICADLRMPEISATLVNRGAQFIVQPTAWVNISREPGGYRNIQPEFMVRARALEFGVPFVCASKCGCETSGMSYVGQSMISSADGQVLAQAGVAGDELIVAEVSPAAQERGARVEPRWLERLQGRAEPFSAGEPGGRCALPMGRGAVAIESALRAAGARVARLEAGELRSFAAARCAALDGAQVIVIDGRVDDDAMARCRAAENRVFVVGVTGGEAYMAIDPEGEWIWRPGRGEATVDIDLSRADEKAFNPRTPIWGQRRVEDYDLSLHPEAGA